MDSTISCWMGKKEGAGNQTVVSYTECSPPPGDVCLLLLLRGSKGRTSLAFVTYNARMDPHTLPGKQRKRGKKELFFSMFVSSKIFCLSWRGCVVSAHKSR